MIINYLCGVACMPCQLFTQIQLQDWSLHLNLLASQSRYGSARFVLVLKYSWRWTTKFCGSILTKQICVRKPFTQAIYELCKIYKSSCPVNVAGRKMKVKFHMFIDSYVPFRILSFLVGWGFPIPLSSIWF